jgi:cholesterol oxidase
MSGKHPTGYDAIVIGSGFGGAVTACRLAEQGFSVLVLERGRHWQDPTQYPKNLFDLKSLLWWRLFPNRFNGWFELRLFKRMMVVQGCGVGGGSLVYANVCINAPEQAFETGWPGQISYRGLEPYYKKVESMLAPETVPPSQVSRRYETVWAAATAKSRQFRFEAVPLAVKFDRTWDPARKGTEPAQGRCNGCGKCIIGCEYGARNTLDVNYLKDARKTHKVDIRPLHVVRKIEQTSRGYWVIFDEIDREHQSMKTGGHEEAPIVVVAAGSLGSTELLLRCRDQYRTLPQISRCLGYNWGANGDFLTLGLYRKQVVASHGVTISCAYDALDGEEFKAPLFIEDGGWPKQLFTKGSHTMPWFGQAMDAADARLFLRRSWLSWLLRDASPQKMKLDLYWKSERSKAVYDAFANAHREMIHATGGWALPSTWAMFGFLASPHPLGGCNMGTTSTDGVVDHRGAVFGYDGLYVVDGSVIPMAIGRNPSKTIAALAERSAEFIAADLRRMGR